jgi:very-short-patch-repair endonuclease
MPVDYNTFRFEPAKRKRAGEYKVCPVCERTFYVTPSHKQHKLFCSRDCQRAFYAVEKVCPVCGKTFSVPRGVADRYTVCSMECKTANTKYLTCERCGKVFRAEKHLNRHYCSEECRRPPIIENCKTCGKEFRRQPNNTDHQFCSFACYRRSKGETLLEQKVREALSKTGIIFQQEARIGRYSVDFYLPTHFVAIEVDGAYWHQDSKKDARKTKFLKSYGLSVVRLKEAEINSCDVYELVVDRLKGITPVR